MIKYKAFIKVAEYGNFTRAAKELGYSQPGISHMIDTLEKEFGFPLLLRNKKNVTPTEDGKIMLDHCYRLVRDEEEMLEAADAINGLMTGTIRIGTLNSMSMDFLPGILIHYLQVYPNIEVQIREFPVDDGSEALLTGQIDLFFGTDRLAKDLEFIPLFQDPICLALHEEHPFTSYDRIPVSALKSCDFIMPQPGWDDLARPLIEALGSLPHIKYTTASETASIALIAHGVGVFPISRLQTDLLPEHVTYREFKEGFHRRMGIGIRSLKAAPASQKEFVKAARKAAEKMAAEGD